MKGWGSTRLTVVLCWCPRKSFLLCHLKQNSSNRVSLPSTSCASLSSLLSPISPHPCPPDFLLHSMVFFLSTGCLLCLLTFGWFYLVLFTIFKQKAIRLKGCVRAEPHHSCKQVPPVNSAISGFTMWSNLQQIRVPHSSPYIACICCHFDWSEVQSLSSLICFFLKAMDTELFPHMIIDHLYFIFWKLNILLAYLLTGLFLGVWVLCIF